MPAGEATAGTAHAPKKVKWLQSERSFTPDGPRWSQRGGGKCLPYALLREGSKWKPQTPAPSNSRVVWRSHVPSCHLGPFSSSRGSQTQGLGSSQDQAPPPAHLSQLFTAEAELWALAGSAKHSWLPLFFPRNEAHIFLYCENISLTVLLFSSLCAAAQLLPLTSSPTTCSSSIPTLPCWQDTA